MKKLSPTMVTALRAYAAHELRFGVGPMLSLAARIRTNDALESRGLVDFGQMRSAITAEGYRVLRDIEQAEEMAAQYGRAMIESAAAALGFDLAAAEAETDAAIKPLRVDTRAPWYEVVKHTTPAEMFAEALAERCERLEHGHDGRKGEGLLGQLHACYVGQWEGYRVAVAIDGEDVIGTTRGLMWNGSGFTIALDDNPDGMPHRAEFNRVRIIVAAEAATVDAEYIHMDASYLRDGDRVVELDGEPCQPFTVDRPRRHVSGWVDFFIIDQAGTHGQQERTLAGRTRVRIMRRPLMDDSICEWYVTCVNRATGLLPHVVLGEVPACERCAKIAAAN